MSSTANPASADSEGSSKLRLGILISGGGSNLQAIIDAIAAGTLDAQIAVVISNKSNAYGLERARAAGIPAIALDPKDYQQATKAETAESFDAAILDALRHHKVDWVAMAGYMRLITSHILDAFPNRVLNLHPSYLPAFPGAHAIRDALDAGVATTGVTVHIANEIFDEGPIIEQIKVPILSGDTFDTLAERVHAVEHVLYPRVLQYVAENRLRVADGKVTVLEGTD